MILQTVESRSQAIWKNLPLINVSTLIWPNSVSSFIYLFTYRIVFPMQLVTFYMEHVCASATFSNWLIMWNYQVNILSRVIFAPILTAVLSWRHELIIFTGHTAGVSYTSSFSSAPIEPRAIVSFGSPGAFVTLDSLETYPILTVYAQIKTTEKNGLIFYNGGREGDYAALELAQVNPCPSTTSN